MDAVSRTQIWCEVEDLEARVVRRECSGEPAVFRRPRDRARQVHAGVLDALGQPLGR